MLLSCSIVPTRFPGKSLTVQGTPQFLPEWLPRTLSTQDNPALPAAPSCSRNGLRQADSAPAKASAPSATGSSQEGRACRQSAGALFAVWTLPSLWQQSAQDTSRVAGNGDRTFPAVAPGRLRFGIFRLRVGGAEKPAPVAARAWLPRLYSHGTIRRLRMQGNTIPMLLG